VLTLQVADVYQHRTGLEDFLDKSTVYKLLNEQLESLSVLPFPNALVCGVLALGSYHSALESKSGGSSSQSESADKPHRFFAEAKGSAERCVFGGNSCLKLQALLTLVCYP
jgi:hypothetical protein